MNHRTHRSLNPSKPVALLGLLAVLSTLWGASIPSYAEGKSRTSVQAVGQELRVSDIAQTVPVVRAAYTVTAAPKPLRPQAVSDPAGAQDIASGMMESYGWNQDEFNCLVSLWDRESGWDASAYNASSGAGGIPQALPASKMASAGADWATNAGTQIAWGLGYINGRYGTPCGAWAHSESSGWY